MKPSMEGVQEEQQKTFIYICLQCPSQREIKLKDPIRCTDCGNRVLRKTRTSEHIQREAL